MQSWLDSIKHVVKPNTLQFYHNYIRLHIVPVLGKVPLAKLTAQQLQAFYSRKMGEGQSSTSVHHMHATLRRALNRAIRLGLVHRNVATLVDAPPPRKNQYTTLSAEDAKKLLEAITQDSFEALYVLALTSGMRRGELLALRWRDVDFEQAVLHVQATLHYNNGKPLFADPKTKQSRRQVALSKMALDALRRHKAKQNEERLALGSLWDSSLDLVFPNTIGKPMNPSNLVHREFTPLLQRVGVPHIRFHDLRHTAATLLLKAGVHPKVVSEMLGHSHVSVTLGVYSHVTPDMQREAASAMNDLLKGSN